MSGAFDRCTRSPQLLQPKALEEWATACCQEVSLGQHNQVSLVMRNPPKAGGPALVSLETPKDHRLLLHCLFNAAAQVVVFLQDPAQGRSWRLQPQSHHRRQWWFSISTRRTQSAGGEGPWPPQARATRYRLLPGSPRPLAAARAHLHLPIGLLRLRSQAQQLQALHLIPLPQSTDCACGPLEALPPRVSWLGWHQRHRPRCRKSLMPQAKMAATETGTDPRVPQWELRDWLSKRERPNMMTMRQLQLQLQLRRDRQIQMQIMWMQLPPHLCWHSSTQKRQRHWKTSQTQQP
mmetsp:Transcript_33185/g.71649  ORF Transcript_33185/g.71649 Transcript_33185/m.71649 type:complete len:292 (+) Transcript_33185:11-886(+)